MIRTLLHPSIAAPLLSLTLALAALARAAVLQARLRALTAQAVTDPLTGAFNRRQLYVALAAAVERRHRAIERASLLLIDVDRFKDINDAFGHAEGDRVLKALVTLIATRFRKLDLVFRIGGEEFVLLLAGTRFADAFSVAEELRTLVRDAALIPEWTLSVSIGVAEVEPQQSVESWLADAATRRSIAPSAPAAIVSPGAARAPAIPILSPPSSLERSACNDTHTSRRAGRSAGARRRRIGRVRLDPFRRRMAGRRSAANGRPPPDRRRRPPRREHVSTGDRDRAESRRPRIRITGVTMNDVHAMNAKHAVDFHAVTRDQAIDLLRRSSAAAAAAIRALSDDQLAHAEPVSAYNDAPLTCQFVLEDHAVRHSYHHLGRHPPAPSPGERDDGPRRLEPGAGRPPRRGASRRGLGPDARRRLSERGLRRSGRRAARRPRADLQSVPAHAERHRPRARRRRTHLAAVPHHARTWRRRRRGHRRGHRRADRDDGGHGERATVLGTTLFSEGHATPYIRLSVGAAEAAAAACHGDGLTFGERPSAARDAILQRMLGVALAHELAHYLLDTAQHSAGGLLRADIRVTELVRPTAIRYPLTLEQQHRLCAARKRP